MYSSISQWQRIRNRILINGESKRSVANSEGISINTLRKMLVHEKPPGYSDVNRRPAATTLLVKRIEKIKPKKMVIEQQWKNMLFNIERSHLGAECPPTTNTLLSYLTLQPNNPRKKILTVVARELGFSIGAITKFLVFLEIRFVVTYWHSIPMVWKVYWEENQEHASQITRHSPKRYSNSCTNHPRFQVSTEQPGD
jgi:hypothetical protein